jgi:hypothetical protein
MRSLSLLQFCRNIGIWIGIGLLCERSAPEITPENTSEPTAVVGSGRVYIPWQRKISYRWNYKDSFHRLQVGSTTSSRFSVQVWVLISILRAAEQTAAWPKISVSRNTDSAVIRHMRQFNGTQSYKMTCCHAEKTWNVTYHNMLI